MNSKTFAAVFMFATFIACTAPGSSPDEPPPPARTFVAFRLPSLVIDHLEVPVEPPYAVGSSKSGSLLSSNDAAIVTIDPNGLLVAHKDGATYVRSTTGSALKVIVEAPQAISVVPAHLELRAGAAQDVQVTANGRAVSAEALHWTTEDPDVAVALGSRVQAGRSPGAANLTVTVGAANATLEVVVLPSPVPLNIEPRRLTMSIGSVRQLKVPDVYASTTRWSTSDGRIVQHLHDGLVLAKARGVARVCAVRAAEKACSEIDVLR